MRVRLHLSRLFVNTVCAISLAKPALARRVFPERVYTVRLEPKHFMCQHICPTCLYTRLLQSALPIQLWLARSLPSGRTSSGTRFLFVRTALPKQFWCVRGEVYILRRRVAVCSETFAAAPANAARLNTEMGARRRFDVEGCVLRALVVSNAGGLVGEAVRQIQILSSNPHLSESDR